MENSLRVRGENKLKKEFENKKCSMITMFGQEKTEESEFMTKQLFWTILYIYLQWCFIYIFISNNSFI